MQEYTSAWNSIRPKKLFASLPWLKGNAEAVRGLVNKASK